MSRPLMGKSTNSSTLPRLGPLSQWGHRSDERRNDQKRTEHTEKRPLRKPSNRKLGSNAAFDNKHKSTFSRRIYERRPRVDWIGGCGRSRLSFLEQTTGAFRFVTVLAMRGKSLGSKRTMGLLVGEGKIKTMFTTPAQQQQQQQPLTRWKTA